jgi:subtilisin family serine protease
MKRKAGVAALLATGTLALALVGASTSSAQPMRSYVVVYQQHVSVAKARAAVEASGGTIVRENLEVGVATVISRNARFVAAVSRQRALVGAALDRPIGTASGLPVGSDSDLAAARASARGGASITAAAATASIGEPFADLQWDMQQIHATEDGAQAIERGDGILVGIIDTGIDGHHPDIAANFDAALSRNFTTDIPLVDGPCEDEPDGSCSDPADVDENSHGTHVASTVASPINDLGVAGVAPEATLVNLRAGQDSGYFFLQPSVDALTYAGDHGIDVVNMSYFIDPWLFNCKRNPADSREAQLEQSTIITATQRALDYAHQHGVVLVAASGNEHTDLGAAIKVDEISPDFPPGSEYERIVDNSCLNLPTEGKNVIRVNSIGPSTRKADYSNYGIEGSSVAAPGGWFRDDPWTPANQLAGIPNLILAAYPKNVAEEFGDIDEDGNPLTPFVLQDCNGSVCGYYQYIQGTSMASPHVTGVAALILGRYGTDIHPNQVLKILRKTSTDHACPEPRLHSYADKLRPPSFDAFCEGTPEVNGFYGYGIVDALAAVTKGAD